MVSRGDRFPSLAQKKFFDSKKSNGAKYTFAVNSLIYNFYN